MRTMKSQLTAALVSAGLLAGFAAPAQAQLPSGIDLHPNADCGIQVYMSNAGGVAMAKADRALSGSYRFTLYQAIPTSQVDINLSGRFSGGGPRDTTLARNPFALGYAVPNGYRGMHELRDAELGQDAHLEGSLQVYDDRGRLVCSTRQVSIMPMSLMQAAADPPQRPSPSASRYNQYGAVVQQPGQRPAARQVQPQRQYTLTRAQCERLRSARPAQCRYDD
ncbi:hypothetical protein [Maricaulis parjimensis]|uniref:hypothetical protein n=1 Tax=Maricaulis parjimensis TaxID=144023 RepID=UPI001939897D|nr:hypothetical protein [Maricaulis parjimensis]